MISQLTVMVVVLAITSVKDLAWMAGTWELVDGARCTEEYWTPPANDALIGMNRTVRAGRTSSFEFLRIVGKADGIYYVAQPNGRPPVDFKLASDTADELIFVNPGHADHLKRIIYRHGPDDSMTARIEGEDNGKPFAVDYAFRRSPSNVASRCGAVK